MECDEVCSYHLQEAGATPEQEWRSRSRPRSRVLDEVKARGEMRRSASAKCSRGFRFS